VRGQDEHAAVGVLLEELLTRLAGPVAVVTEAAVLLRLGHLHRAVHEIPGEHCLPGRRRQPHGDVARRVPWRGLEGQAGAIS
jgi:hypothetical protein